MKILSLIEKAFFLKNISLFRDLDLDLLIAIAEKIHQDLYDANEIVFETNQIANRLFFIAKGSVQIFDKNKKELQILKINDFFGEESLFNENPRAYIAGCKEASLLLSINKAKLFNIISECPSVAIELLNIYSKKLSNRHIDEN